MIEPRAWMHDGEGRVDVIAKEVKEIWLKVDPRYVSYYTIPLTTVAAVLAALREPSEAMMGAARNVLLNGGRMSDAFLAMLDQFEKEQQP